MAFTGAPGSYRPHRRAGLSWCPRSAPFCMHSEPSAGQSSSEAGCCPGPVSQSHRCQRPADLQERHRRGLSGPALETSHWPPSPTAGRLPSARPQRGPRRPDAAFFNTSNDAVRNMPYKSQHTSSGQQPPLLSSVGLVALPGQTGNERRPHLSHGGNEGPSHRGGASQPPGNVIEGPGTAQNT